MANEARFETHLAKNDTTRAHGESPFRDGVYWHFRDANGRVTFTGGEDFADRDGAHRAIFGAVMDGARIILGQSIGLSPAGILVRDFLDDGRHLDFRLIEVDGKVVAKDAAERGA